MSIRAWLLLAGLLLLTTSLLGGWLRRTPLTPFALYVATGIAVGPWVADTVSVDLIEHARFVERASEAALVVSLFIGGLKLRALWHGAPWQAAMRLAIPAMLLTIAFVTIAAHALLGAPWSMAMLFAAAVAPTDPVLASMVSVGHAGDDDGVRVALSGEAGLNDGTALPFLLLALRLHQGHVDATVLRSWFIRDVIWAIPVGIIVGFVLARLTGILATLVKVKSQDPGPNDLLTLALIAITYAAAQYLHASVFLAAFAAGIGLRHTEWRVVSRHPSPEAEAQRIHPPAELLVNPHQRNPEQMSEPSASIGMVISDALTFGDAFERVIAAVLLVLLGVAFASYVSLEGLMMAAVLFFIVRPAAVLLATIGSGLSLWRRLILGWLGVRGIGSLYYAAFAAIHGLSHDEASVLVSGIVTTVVISVAVHGMSTQPIMAWRAARVAQRASDTSPK